MSILKYKYKAHKFINYVFYVIVFLVGFLIGFGSKEINFNKLISQVLMIDNVSAKTLTIDYNNSYFNQVEEKYNLNNKYTYLKEYLDNTTYITNYATYYYDGKIIVAYSTSNKSNINTRFNYKNSDFIFEFGGSPGYFDVRVFEININNTLDEFTDLINNLYNYNYDDTDYLNYYSSSNSGYTYIFGTTTNSIYQLTHNSSTSIYPYDIIMPWVIDLKNVSFVNLYKTSSDYLMVDNNKFKYNSSIINSEGMPLTYWNNYINTKLEFNENLFKDNSNFKEVCVEKGKKYGITTTNIDPISNTAFVSDFIWFPGKITGVKYSEYDSLNDNNILIFNDDVSTENYYFEDKDKIDSFYNDEIISNYFNHSGYTDKYSYYGYTAYKFMHSYYVDENDNPQNMFTIFDFTDIDYSSINSGGGAGTPFGLNDNTSLNYCFYIKNEFNVTELKTDEWNDYTGVVPTPGGDLEVNTSHNKNNSNTEDFLSQPKNFIISMKDTINLINSLIYEFYMSLPAILRTFIITALIILIIMLIMKIGGYK